jgi:hypothetical protein
MSQACCASAQTFLTGHVRAGLAHRRKNTPTRKVHCRPMAAIAPAPNPAPAQRSDAEVRAEEAILAGDDSDGTIAGFTKREWSCIQTPARYLGNEIGAMHKDWDSAEVRFTMGE